MRVRQSDSITYLQFEGLAEIPGLVCAVSTRHGGVSQGPWRSLNLSFRVGDDPQAVLRNRQLLCKALGISLESLTLGQQVHGTGVAIVQDSERGRGAISWESALPATDGLITNKVGPLLTVLVADCAPVVFYDPVHQVVGLAHLGWRGAIGGIAEKMVGLMSRAFGTNPADLVTSIGPCIGPCCYEVGEAVLGPLRQSSPYWGEFVIPRGSSAHFDLLGFIARQLLDAGVPPMQIERAELCTTCHTSLLYSHRAEGGHTGRFATVIGFVPTASRGAL